LLHIYKNVAQRLHEYYLELGIQLLQRIIVTSWRYHEEGLGEITNVSMFATKLITRTKKNHHIHEVGQNQLKYM
jgi:hypothetical protein